MASAREEVRAIPLKKRSLSGCYPVALTLLSLVQLHRPGRRATARGVARHTDTRARGQHARAASSLRELAQKISLKPYKVSICLSRGPLSSV